MQTDVLKVTNYYDIIGVPMDATVEVIKARYRALSKSYHPDAGGSEAQMAQLNEAYRVLTSPLERAALDRHISREQATRRANAAAAAQARKAERARTQQVHDDEFFAAAARNASVTTPPKKKSTFWKYMAWGTAAYVVLGLAIIYFVTIPTTATSDTAQTTQPSASLSQEAADASAAIPSSTPLNTQAADTSNGSPTITQSSATDTEPTQQSQTTSETSPQSDATNTEPTSTTTQPPKKHFNWRHLMQF